MAKRRPYTPVEWKIVPPRVQTQEDISTTSASQLRDKLKKALGEGESLPSEFPITGDLMSKSKAILEGIPRDYAGQQRVNWRGYRRKPFYASLGRNPENFNTLTRRREGNN